MIKLYSQDLKHTGKNVKIYIYILPNQIKVKSFTVPLTVYKVLLLDLFSPYTRDLLQGVELLKDLFPTSSTKDNKVIS